MKPNLSFALAALFCFVVWWIAVTAFVHFMGPYMRNYQ